MISSGNKIEIDLDSLSKLYPFVMIVDNDMIVTRASKAIHSRIAHPEGMTVSELLDFRESNEKLSFSLITGMLGTLCKLTLRTKDSEMQLAGQFSSTQNGFLLLAKPDARNAEELKLFEFDDFPYFDHLVELIVARDESAISLNEATSAAEILKIRNIEIEKKNDELDVKLTEINNQRNAILNMMKDMEKSRKQIESANVNLQKERDRAQNYLDIAGVMIVALDTEKNVKLINKKGCEILGYEECEILGKNWFDNFLPEREKERVKKVSDMLLDGEIVQSEYYENPILTRKGEERLIAWHNSILINKKGAITGHLSSGADITEKKASEKKIHKLAQKLSMHLQQTPIGYMEWDSDFRVVEWNPSAERIFGYDAEEAKGQDTNFIIPESAKMHVDEVWQNLVSQTGGQQTINENITKDGQIIICEWINTPLTHSDGKVFGVSSLVIDITERIKAEEELKKRTRNLNKRVNELNCLYGTSKILDTPNISLDERINKILNILPSGWQYSLITCAALVMDGILYQTENYRETEWKIVEDIIVDDKSIGKITVCYLERRSEMLEDIFLTEERNLLSNIADQIGIYLERTMFESALEDSQRFIKKVLDNLKDAVFILDSETLEITDCNLAAVRIFQYVKHEMTGKSITSFIEKSGDVENFKQELISVVSEKGQMHIFDTSMSRKDGNTFSAECNFRPLLDQNKNRIGWVVSINDITMRKILESELAQGQKLQSIGQLAAGIAHEINTPTQFVSDNTRFLKDSFGDLTRLIEKYKQLEEAVKSGSDTKDLLPEITGLADEIDIEFLCEDIPKAIDQSLGGLERVSKIVQAMKDFAHPGISSMKPENLNKIIESTVTVARNEWKYVSEMKLDLDPGIPMVFCMGGEMSQVVLNIIVNASHAIADANKGEEGKMGEIKISTHADGEWVEIRITDTGTGIPDESKNKVFEHFYTTKEVGKGTGQGLSLARGIVTEKHKGSISFETKMGVGTTFIIKLPVADISEAKEDALNEETCVVC